MSYVELHARSAFSFLRGASLPEDLAKTAAQLGIGTLALCDRDGLYGAPRFAQAAQEQGLRALIGCELSMSDGAILPVLVENKTGYHNLCTLLSTAHLRAPKGQCAIGWEELPAYAQGLVALTGDEDGPLQRALQAMRRAGNPVPSPSLLPDTAPARAGAPSLDSPQEVLERLSRIFGSTNVFVEVQRHRLRGENRRVAQLVAAARAHRLPLLASNGVLHAQAPGRQVLDMFTCLRHHTHLDAAGHLLSPNGERHLKDAAQMQALFADLPEAIANTGRLAERLTFSLQNIGYEFPAYQPPDELSESEYLRRATDAGAHQRYGPAIPDKVQRQLRHELALIDKLGFAGYFLIVWDIVNFCRADNIMVQGRGSAANSAVCYCLGITAVDAVECNLLFERFLSEGRKSWPDIDLDLPSGARRERVIQEIYRRYGRHGAAMTANVITYRGRSAAREIGKALNFSPELSERFSALFSSSDDPAAIDGRLRAAGIPREHPRTPAFLSLYQALAGLPRHLGQHSGGMIICKDKLSSVVPLENASMPGRSVAQWDKTDCAQLGIIKVDLLGLGMMAALQDAVELCALRGHPVDLATIPKDDSATFDLMCEADTIGVFQIESRAQMATLPRMQPRCFYDVCIEVAIIRPGPIQGDLVHPYLARRTGQEPVYYDDPRLIPVLARTLGVPLFQEQLLRIAMVLGDFSGSEAEDLRKALSFQRSPERMKEVTQKLSDRMLAKGIATEAIERIVKSVGSFALYGFPESHALSFAILAYGSAWLKVHRPAEFYTSLLNNQPMGFYSPATLIEDARRHGMRIRPVCVARSDWPCVIQSDNSLRLGLCIVRGLNPQRAGQLLASRQQRPFASLEELKARVALHKDEWRVLAEVGALNTLAAHRRDALWQIEREQLPPDDLFALRPSPSPTLVPSSSPAAPIQTPLAAMTPSQRLKADYEGLGLTTGAHPMALIREQLPDLWRASDLTQAHNKQRLRIAGCVICRQRPGTAKGFVFLSLEDETGIANIILTPKLFEAQRLLLVQESYLWIEGIAQIHQGVLHIRAEQVGALRDNTLSPVHSHDFH